MNKPLEFVLLLLVLFWGYVFNAVACEEDKSFGCTPWVDCMPVAGGWNYIRR